MTDLLRSRGRVHQRIRDIEAEKVDLIKRMEGLSQDFQQTFRRPWPAHPVVQRIAGGHVYVRWRCQGRNGKQNYVDLAGEAGQALVLVLEPPVRRAYVRFGQQMLNLNVAHAVRHSECVRLRQYLGDCIVLEGYVPAP